MRITPYGRARTSRQRDTIAEAVELIGAAFTVDDLVCAIRDRRAGAGVATVYRAVSAMEESGWIERVGSREGRALYARCRGGAHHHHAVCTSCGTVLATDCPLEAAALSAEVEHGFTVTAHEVTLYGLCRTCQVSENNAAGDGD